MTLVFRSINALSVQCCCYVLTNFTLPPSISLRILEHLGCQIFREANHSWSPLELSGREHVCDAYCWDEIRRLIDGCRILPHYYFRVVLTSLLSLLDDLYDPQNYVRRQVSAEINDECSFKYVSLFFLCLYLIFILYLIL